MMEIDINQPAISDEEYLVLRAKHSLTTDPLTAKAWMITAKTLFPNNFSVQFEAYCIEKSGGHVKEAAKCFSDLLSKFQQQPELWKEIEQVTAALRLEKESLTPSAQFLCEMFKHIPGDTQHQLLLFTADHCEDTMEHCRLLLLLLQRFPQAISSHGPRLVDTLLSAEKHSHAGAKPVNCYRKLLVCELLPLLGDDTPIEFSSKLLFRLLHKSIEFYLCYLLTPTSALPDGETKVEDPWIKLFKVLELTGRHLGWEPYLINFSSNWTKEGYWQKIVSFCQTHNALTIDDHTKTKQLLYCITIFFLHCLHEYFCSLSPEAAPGQLHTTLIPVEGFTDPSMPYAMNEPKPKRRKTGDADGSLPYITVDKPGTSAISSNFTLASSCWDLIHSADFLQREFVKLASHLKLESWLAKFVIEYAIYKGRYDDALMRLQQVSDSTQFLNKNLKLASVLFCKKNYGACFEHVLQIIPTLPLSNVGKLSSSLTVGGNQRHLHYLPLTHMAVLQYCTRLLFYSIKEVQPKGGTINEMALGHLFVLMQLDWPQLEEHLPQLMECIQQKRSFQYSLFQPYIINVDILEELMYLWTEQGGQITLDILPIPLTGSQRRIGTRGADKGVKEEIRQTMKRQIARSNEPLDQLIIKFISLERMSILQTLMPM